MSLSKLLFSFDGRIPRSAFLITTVMLNVAARYIAGMTLTLDADRSFVWAAFWVVVAVAAYLDFALCAKRFHDLDKSGWWSLVMLIPIVNLFFSIELIFFQGTRGSNRFGPDPVPSEHEAGAAESTSNTEQTPIIAQSARGSSLALEIKAKSAVMESKPESDSVADKTEPNPLERKRRSFNPFLIKAEGPRRLSIALACIALTSWLGFIAVVSKGFADVSGGAWLFVFGVPLAAYLLVLIVLRITFWVMSGFESGQHADH